MNCDTAFELMTDADGSRSLALAGHLDDCPRCRAMQATLAPALDFLAPHGAGEAVHESAAAFALSAGAGRRQPLVTAEALAVARHCAADLTARTDAPRVRLQRLAVKSLRYAAVFAAGLLFALTLFEAHRPAAPGPGDAGKCTRHEAARNGAQRTPAEARALALSCARCHRPLEDQHESSTSSLELKPADDFECLQQILGAETLLARTSCRRAPLAPGIG